MKKQQVMVVHGGTLHDSYEDYFQYLEDYPLEKILKKSGKKWKEVLSKRLDEKYDVIFPSMPKTYTCSYKEWKIWFEKYLPVLHDDIVLVGHSLGATFWLKYLSENTLPIKIQSLHLVAGGCGPTSLEPVGDFDLMDDLTNITEQCDRVFIYHSEDDPVVPYEHGQSIHGMLPIAEFVSFDDRGHFITEEFPELAERIKNVA